MTQEEKRIAIAEVCGWKWFQKGNKEADVFWLTPEGKHYWLPDYFNDLNSMHEAEKVLDDMQRRNYVSILTGRSFVQDSEITRVGCWNALHATASQRAETFGKVLNLWLSL